MSMDLTDDKSTLVQVMAWCCQATSHYLNQCHNVDPDRCHHLASLPHNELILSFYNPRDAAWELEENAFQDLLHRHNRCDQRKCRCPRGRSFINKKWTIILCNACGSMGAHVQCAELKSAKARWHCPDCKQLLGKSSLVTWASTTCYYRQCWLL